MARTQTAVGTPSARIGMSGWTYAPWRGGFFPKGLRQKDELAFASRQVNSIEINGTFYSLQRPESFGSWYAQTPAGFVFSVKCPRFITHVRRLKEVEAPLANFFASGVLRLADKLGPFLWQLPPSLPYEPERLEAFFRLLPRTTVAAARLARRHDDHLRHGAWLKPGPERPLRHALEVRHPSFKTPEFIALLRRHHIGLVVADTANRWPAIEDVTADFVYVRLHGQSELYVSGYTDEALDRWAAKVRAWMGGRSLPGPHRIAGPAPKAAQRDVFVYFDNDVKTRAPFDAISLASRLGQPVPPPRTEPWVEPDEKPRRGWPALRRSARKAA
jgi:uncharacterized protein YecE (DUF72 family)